MTGELGVVVVAPDKFRGSLTASQAADAIGNGVLDALPDHQVIKKPIADGGEGTIECLISAGARRKSVRAQGPLGQYRDVDIAVDGATAYIEVAQACGVGLIVPSPETALKASSFGVGELILSAISDGATTIVLAVGGTASTDGGLGMLHALGADLTATDGGPLPTGGGALIDLRAVEFSGMADISQGIQFRIASDVRNELLGPAGAARMFGPQKGATARQVEILESGMNRVAEQLANVTGFDVATVPGLGAGGGIGLGLLSALGADAVSIESGAEMVLNAIGFEESLEHATWMITGEGSFDEQTLHGKAPLHAIQTANRHGVSCGVVAGRTLIAEPELKRLGVTATAELIGIEPNLERAHARAAELLTLATRSMLARAVH